MKKIGVCFLSAFTIAICCWYIIEQIDLLDIVSTKNDQYSAFQKREISERNDIDECEKEILKSQIDFKRQKTREISRIASKTQFVLIGIIVIQLVLSVMVLLLFRNKKPDLK